MSSTKRNLSDGHVESYLSHAQAYSGISLQPIVLLSFIHNPIFVLTLLVSGAVSPFENIQAASVLQGVLPAVVVG